jgi:vacuolar protein sorting-associated protein 8
VTSLAISEDSTTIAVGHAEGHIFTWELAKPTRPFLHIPPLDVNPAQSRKADGHMPRVAIIHVGFLGFRHTAIVSANDRGMAFSHLATRGMGSVGRAVRTTRVLGRYPDIIIRGQKPRKPSSVLAFSSLPFGNVEQALYTLGLVAMMTPYLLVIVSTTPIAQTQHKAARPKEITAHSAMTAALAWFPSIKLKAQDAGVSRSKLVYCWSNVLTVLEISEVEPSEPVEKEKPVELAFRARSRWKSEEAIVAVQWLSRSVIAILTITQQLIVLEDVSMTPTDSFDLVQKQIYHSDLFSQQLHSLVEQLDEEDTSMHGVVADAFYMSFRAYKGRLFLLGVNDVSIGSLSNWADRLLAMLEAGDFVGAIRLATAYYSGEGEKVTIGLPEDDNARHTVVREKLLEMMSASLKYAFGQNEQAETGQLDDSQLMELASACVTAVLSLEDTEFLFDEVFAWFVDHYKATILLDVIEPYILEERITSVPPTALKTMIDHFMTTHTPATLEEIICRLDTSTMDIDQVINLCKGYKLYDALIYVWTNALGDYIGPIEELLKLVPVFSQPNGHAEEFSQAQQQALKVFPYLSFTLTSQIYPTGTDGDYEESEKAKDQIYNYLFSANSEYATRESKGKKPRESFPHLRQLLSFDTASTMSVLNEAFEDNYLNRRDQLDDSLDRVLAMNGTSESKTCTRQFIITVLLEILSSGVLEQADAIFIDMFIARNLPKYPQDLVLSGTTLNQILTRLCHFSDEDVAEECQLSVEYLLSVYHPPDLRSFVSLFQEAHFFRVLKSVYRLENQWAQLVQVFFLDEQDQDGVFEVIRTCLRKGSQLNSKQQREVRDLVKTRALDLARIDVRQLAATIAEVLPDFHEHFLNAFRDDNHLQYQYLRTLLESKPKAEVTAALSAKLVSRFIQLLCQYEPSHVGEYVSTLGDVDLQLEDVLPSMEDSGVIDAAVVLMARQGQVQNALDRLVQHLSSLEAALKGILHNVEAGPDETSTSETIHGFLESIDKYSGVGIWLCQRQTKAAHRSRPVTKPSRRSSAAPQLLSVEENLWLQLISAVVSIAKSSTPKERGGVIQGNDQTASSLRAVVQNVFTALLKATTTSREVSGDRSDFSFLQILRAFLTQEAASSPSLAELRAVISSIFSAYSYEESLLSLSNSMLDKDLFVHVDEINKLRRRGWRPRGQVCEICRRRVWGPGAGTQIWDSWLKREEQGVQHRRDREHGGKDEDSNVTPGKGKATAEAPTASASQADATEGESSSMKASTGPALIFACRHLFHETCLDLQTGRASGERDTPLRGHEHLERVCPVCSTRT